MPLSPAAPSRGATLGALALVAGAAVIALVKLRYGLLWGDEGFYLATSRALLVGGVPFRDDLSHVATWFFVVLTPLLALLPDGATLLHVREVGLLLRLGACGVLYASFRRCVPAPVLGAGLAATLLANFPYQLVPSYNNVPFDAACVGVAAWIAGAASARRARAIAWGAVAGAFFALAALCHLPRAALLLVPLLVLLWIRRHDAGLPGLRASSAACLILSTGALGTALGSVVAAGWLPDLLSGWGLLLHSRTFSLAPGARLLRLVGQDLPRLLGAAAVHGAFWGGALLLGARAATARASHRLAPALAIVALIALYAALLVYVYLRGGARWFSAYYLVYPALCWLPLFAWPALRGTLRALGPVASCGAALLFVTLLAQQLVVALTSTQGAAAGAPGVGASLLLLLLMSVAAAARLSGAEPPAGRPASTPGSRWGAGVAAALCLVLAASAAAFHFCPEENPLRADLGAFRTGRLAGLYTTPRRVAGWTELVAYLLPRVARGELLLAYTNVPLVYYATDTRPALGATVVSPLLLGPAQQRALVRRMQARGHVPHYAVRLREGTLDEAVAYSLRPRVDPVNAFVHRHYRLEARLTLFEVWRLSDRRLERGAVSARTAGGTP